MRLAAHVANGCKSLIRPSSGKDTAKTKGVHREVESEGRWRQNSGLTNRNHMRLNIVFISQAAYDIFSYDNCITILFKIKFIHNIIMLQIPKGELLCRIVKQKLANRNRASLN